MTMTGPDGPTGRTPAAPPRRRVSDGAKSARTQERILDAAAQVLSRKGYAGTRLSDIAAVAELQTPALYYYYPSREALIEAVIRRGQARAQDHVEAALAALAPGGSALGKICVAVEEHLRGVLDLSSYTTAAIRNVGQLPDDMRKRLLAEQARYGTLWRRLFEEARAHGELRDGLDPHAAQQLVVGALNWAPEWWNPRRFPVDAVVATATSLVRAGLSPHAVPATETETETETERSIRGRH